MQERNARSVTSWIRDNKPLVAKESSFLTNWEDLVAPNVPNTRTMTEIFIGNCAALLHSYGIPNVRRLNLETLTNRGGLLIQLGVYITRESPLDLTAIQSLIHFTARPLKIARQSHPFCHRRSGGFRCQDSVNTAHNSFLDYAHCNLVLSRVYVCSDKSNSSAGIVFCSLHLGGWPLEGNRGVLCYRNVRPVTKNP